MHDEGLSLSCLFTFAYFLLFDLSYIHKNGIGYLLYPHSPLMILNILAFFLFLFQILQQSCFIYFLTPKTIKIFVFLEYLKSQTSYPLSTNRKWSLLNIEVQAVFLPSPMRMVAGINSEKHHLCPWMAAVCIWRTWLFIEHKYWAFEICVYSNLSSKLPFWS
jgi:hypothetical protein